jgi:hypothetical protein
VRLERSGPRNTLRVGAAMLRYAAGRMLSAESALWQAALLVGVLRGMTAEGAVDPALCITLDGWGGAVHAAPRDTLRRCRAIAAACERIGARWQAVSPPAAVVSGQFPAK